MKLEWVGSRGFVCTLICDGQSIAQILFREPGCYLAALSGEKPSTHDTEREAKAWCVEQIRFRLAELDVFDESPVSS